MTLMLKRPIPKRPAPKLSTKSPNARPPSLLSTVESPASKLSFTMDDTMASPDVGVSDSRDSCASDDFASPFVIRRDTPQQMPEGGSAETTQEQEEPTKEDGSTIAKYVERFRQTQPLSRIERARSGLQARPADFWWTGTDTKEAEKTSKTRSEIGVAFKSPFGTSAGSRATNKRVRFVEDCQEATTTKKEVPRSLIPRPTRPEQDKSVVEEWENGSSCPAVSTDGLDSNLSSNDSNLSVLRPGLDLDLDRISEADATGEEEEDLTFRPQFLKSAFRVLPATSSSPPIKLADSDDILARWRLKNQMELAREKSRLQPDLGSAPSPARHHFRRSDAPAVARHNSQTAALHVAQPVVPVAAPPTPPQPPQPARTDAGIQTASPRLSPVHTGVQTSQPASPRPRKTKKKKREREKQKAVIGAVVASGLGLDSSVRTSINSVFGQDVRRSTERASTARMESAVPDLSLDELVTNIEEKAARFPDDVIVRQLLYQLHTKLEQISLIDEELRSRYQM